MHAILEYGASDALPLQRDRFGDSYAARPSERAGGQCDGVAVLRLGVVDSLYISRRAIRKVNRRPRVGGENNAHKQGEKKRPNPLHSDGLSVVLATRRPR